MTVIGVRYCDHCAEETPASDGTNRCLRCGRLCAGAVLEPDALAVAAIAETNDTAPFAQCDGCRWPGVCTGDETCWRAERDKPRNGHALNGATDQLRELRALDLVMVGDSTGEPPDFEVITDDLGMNTDVPITPVDVEISAGDAGCDADDPASPATGDVSPASPTPAEETGTTSEADGTVFDVGDVTGQPAPAAARREHYSVRTRAARRAKVITDIQALAEQLGRQPTRRDDEALHSRARSAFPSWADAVEEAGYERPRRGGFRAKPIAAPADPPPEPAPEPEPCVMPDTPSLHDLERAALDAELTYHLVRAHYLRERIRLHGSSA